MSLSHRINSTGWRQQGSGPWVPPASGELVFWGKTSSTDVGTVQTWTDQASSNDMSQATASKRPTTTGGNHAKWGYGYVFDATDDEWDTGGPALTKNYRAIALGFELLNGGGGAGAILAHSAAVAGWPGLFCNAGPLQYRASDFSTVYQLEVTATIGYHRVIAVEDLVGGTLNVWFDGSHVSVDQVLGGSYPQNSTVRAWANGWAFRERVQYPLLVWESNVDALSAGEVASVDDYLDPVSSTI